MVTNVMAITRQELHTTTGEVYAYVLPAEEVEQLREEIKRLRRERDAHAARIAEMIRTWVPGPMSAEEIRELEQNPGNLSTLIAELERK